MSEFNSKSEFYTNCVVSTIRKLDQVTSELSAECFINKGENGMQFVETQEARHLPPDTMGLVKFKANFPRICVVGGKAMELHVVLTTFSDELNEPAMFETEHQIFSHKNGCYYSKVKIGTEESRQQDLILGRIAGTFTNAHIIGLKPLDPVDMPGLLFDDKDKIAPHNVLLESLYESYSQTLRLTPGCNCFACEAVRHGKKLREADLSRLNNVGGYLVGVVEDLAEMARRFSTIPVGVTTGRDLKSLVAFITDCENIATRMTRISADLYTEYAQHICKEEDLPIEETLNDAEAIFEDTGMGLGRVQMLRSMLDKDFAPKEADDYEAEGYEGMEGKLLHLPQFGHKIDS